MQLQSRGATKVTVHLNKSPATGRVQEGRGRGRRATEVQAQQWKWWARVLTTTIGLRKGHGKGTFRCPELPQTKVSNSKTSSSHTFKVPGIFPLQFRKGTDKGREGGAGE